LGKNYRWIKCYVNGNYIMQNTLGTWRTHEQPHQKLIGNTLETW
jgi:hypothetical protein